MKLRDLAERLECRLDGDGDVVVDRVAGIENAGPGELTFLSNPRYAAALKTTRASAVIVAEGAPSAPCAMLRSSNPYLSFARAIRVFAGEARAKPGIHAMTSIAPDVEIGADVSIGPFVSIGAAARIGARVVIGPNVTIGEGAVIGEDAFLHARVSIREHVVLGHRVVVQDGAVIGSDGFGFARRADGTYEKIPQPGRVVIEDDVEVGANTTIDRPAVGETRIKAGTKVDNLVQIGHGVSVGRNTLLCAQVGIAGSSTVGDGVVLAGQVGVAGHIEIGDGVVATAQTGVPNSVDPGTLISGYPAIPNRDWLKASAVFRRLPELKKSLADIESRLSALEKSLAGR